MKKLSVLIIIAALCLVGWVLPAGAEKIRLTDAELDGITAGFLGGFLLNIPPPTSIACCVTLVSAGNMVAMGPPPFALAFGTLNLSITIPIGTVGPAGVNINAIGTASNPPPLAVGGVNGVAVGPVGVAVPFGFTFP